MQKNPEILFLKRLFIAITASLTLTAIVSYLIIRWDTKNDRVNDITYTSNVIKNYLELSFKQWELSLLSVGKRLLEIEESERLSYANNALKLYDEDLLAFGLANPDGQITSFTAVQKDDSLPNLAKSEKTRRSFELATKATNITVGETYFFENVNNWILPIRVPIRDDQGKLLAVNTSAIDLNKILVSLSNLGLNANYKIHIINKNFGTTQLYYPLAKADYERIIGKNKHSYNYSEIDSLSDHSFRFKSKSSIEGSDVLGVKTLIEPVNHDLIVLMDYALLDSDTWKRYYFILIVYVVLVFITIFLYHYLKFNQNRYLSSQANMNAIFESTASLIALFDKNQLIIEFNQALAKTVKHTDDVILRKGSDLFAQIKSKDHSKLFRGFVSRALSGQTVKEVVKYPGPKESYYFELVFRPVYHNGLVDGVAFFGTDITESIENQRQLEEFNSHLSQLVERRTEEIQTKNKELEEGYSQLQSTQQKLIQAEKMASLGVLASGVAHEINNPLNFIKNGASAIRLKIQEGNTDLDELRTYFNIIDEGVKRAADIVTGLSHFSAQTVSLEENCNLYSIIENCLIILANKLRRKYIHVVKDFKVNEPLVKGSEGKLHQAILSILSNAEQAIEKQGRILISITENDTHYTLEVEDTGQGISKSNLSKISDPFFTTKPPGEGTGLGLFITYLIVEEHHGTIDVESEIGKGTTLKINFLKPGIS